eukprot:137548_1
MAGQQSIELHIMNNEPTTGGSVDHYEKQALILQKDFLENKMKDNKFRTKLGTFSTKADRQNYLNNQMEEYIKMNIQSPQESNAGESTENHPQITENHPQITENHPQTTEYYAHSDIANKQPNDNVMPLKQEFDDEKKHINVAKSEQVKQIDYAFSTFKDKKLSDDDKTQMMTALENNTFDYNNCTVKYFSKKMITSCNGTDELNDVTNKIYNSLRQYNDYQIIKDKLERI